MHANEQLIHNFYSAFLDKDYQTMQNSYADEATFSDPVFQHLSVQEVRAMWEMFCKRGKDMQLTFSIQHADDKYVHATWIPNYTFSATGRPVTNYITSKFTIVDKKIVSHVDHFNFYKWSSQALGLSGTLLGWTPMVKNKVRKTAMKNLHIFMQKSAS